MHFTVTIDLDFIGRNVRRNIAIPWSLGIRRQRLSTRPRTVPSLFARATLSGYWSSTSHPFVNPVDHANGYFQSTLLFTSFSFRSRQVNATWPVFVQQSFGIFVAISSPQLRRLAIRVPPSGNQFEFLTRLHTSTEMTARVGVSTDVERSLRD